MILCDREVQALLEEGQVLIDPLPDANSELWSSTALDLTLASVLVQWKATPPTGGGPVPPIQPAAKNFDVQGMMEDSHYATKLPIDPDPDKGYDLAPKSFILGFTEQRIRLPNRCRIAARVEGKSSLARLGIGVHITAPTIHAGFGAKEEDDKGTPIQLEIFNLGPWSVKLVVGMRICQMIFEEVREVPRAGYRGQFNKQKAFTVPVKDVPAPKN